MFPVRPPASAASSCWPPRHRSTPRPHRKAARSGRAQPQARSGTPPSRRRRAGLHDPALRVLAQQPARRHVRAAHVARQLRHLARPAGNQRGVRQRHRRRPAAAPAYDGLTMMSLGLDTAEGVRLGRRHVQRQRAADPRPQPQHRQPATTCRPPAASRPTAPPGCGSSGTSRRSWTAGWT